MKHRIIVYVSDKWKESTIANVQDTLSNREKINSIIESLNRKYLGFNRFGTREITIIKKRILINKNKRSV